MTFRTASSRFQRQLAADGRSPLTVRVYKSELARFSQWLGDRPLVKVRPDTLARYLTDPAAQLSPTGAKRSVRTMNRTRTVMRLFFTYLTDTGVFRDNPARVIRNARTDRPLPVVLTDDETRRFLHALDVEAKGSEIGTRDQVLFSLLLGSGMRLAAALALDVADVDFNTGIATSHGKHGRIQGVFLPRNVTKMLARHLRNAGISSGPIFLGRNGRLSSRQAQYRFRALVDLAGVERPVTVHSLRRAFATTLRRRTGDLRVVQKLLGHRHLSTTESYLPVGEEELRRAVG